MNTMHNRALLIVDDEPNVTSSLNRQLSRDGYTIYAANSGRTGLELLKENDIGVVLSDLIMPEMDGVTFLELVKQHKPAWSEEEALTEIKMLSGKVFDPDILSAFLGIQANKRRYKSKEIKIAAQI